MGYYQTSRAAFPDLRHGNVRCHAADDTVIVEFDLLGTNLGEFYGMPPTGNAFGVPAIAVSSSTATASSTGAFTSIPSAC
jgi:predicted ester cyclase